MANLRFNLLCVKRLSRIIYPQFYKSCHNEPRLKLLSCLNDSTVQNYLTKMEDKIKAAPKGAINNIPRIYFYNLYTARKEVMSNLKALSSLKDDEKPSKEMSEMIIEEETKYANELKNIEFDLLKSFAPLEEDGNEVIVEITAGVGGKEASLFCKDLFEMYCGYANYKNWTNFVDELDSSELGGIRHARVYIEGDGVFRCLSQESGVHRVQRVPATEKSGRIHTSTVTVAVLPQTPLVEIHVSEKDLIVDTMRSSGAGGQHVNRTDSAVRLTHVPSGVVVECQEDRSQIKNRQIAMQKLKMRLHDKMVRDHDSKIRGSRKAQVGTSARSDKVRTYNFPQDRISDHRLLVNIHNVPMFLKGEDLLDTTINKLIDLSEEEKLNAFVESIRSNKV